jgi:hypothetical protein
MRQKSHVERHATPPDIQQQHRSDLVAVIGDLVGKRIVPQQVFAVSKSALRAGNLQDRSSAAVWSVPRAAEQIQIGKSVMPWSRKKNLQCLGAAVATRWNDLLFASAATVSEPLHTTELKEQIARSLHNRKDLRPTG